MEINARNDEWKMRVIKLEKTLTEKKNENHKIEHNICAINKSS